MSLTEQIEKLIDLKNNGWNATQILTGFDEIHRDNLAIISNKLD